MLEEGGGVSQHMQLVPGDYLLQSLPTSPLSLLRCVQTWEVGSTELNETYL